MAVPLTEPWTIEQLDRLPDDSNRYELLAGELLVTPPPSEAHETIVARLTALLVPFVVANGLGFVYHPRSIVQVGGERTEPDLMVRPESLRTGWANAPIPILVVEVLSRSTRDRDFGKKRRFYMKAGVAEYWIVDRQEEVVVQVRHHRNGSSGNHLRTRTSENPGSNGLSTTTPPQRPLPASVSPLSTPSHIMTPRGRMPLSRP